MKSFTNLVKQINRLHLHNPTIIAGDKKVKSLCVKLVKVYGSGSNFAYIEDKKHEYGYGNTLELYGHINQEVIIVFSSAPMTRIQHLDIYDLVKCSGARLIYVKELNKEFSNSELFLSDRLSQKYSKTFHL